MAVDVTAVEVTISEIVEVSAICQPVEVVERVAGIQGPPGQKGDKGDKGDPGAGGDSHYSHNQAVSSDTWVITHNLNKFPSVMCFDSSYDEIEGSISYQGQNQLTVTFSSPTGGYAYLN